MASSRALQLLITFAVIAPALARPPARGLTALNLNTSVAASIQNVDNRQAITDPRQSPFNQIGPIISTYSDGSLGSCTGALIASNVVLTAAHCLYSYDKGLKVKSAVFAPGFSTALRPAAPAGIVNMLTWQIPTAFINCGIGRYTECHKQYDFGLMTIDADFTLWMSVGYDNLNTGGQVVNTAGYPGDRDDCFNTAAGTSCLMYHVACTDGIISPTATHVDSDCFTFHGQSGSPVWLYYPSTKVMQIRGILASAADKGGAGTFTLINQDVFGVIKAFLDNA